MEFEDFGSGEPSKLPRAWDIAHGPDTRIISERVPDDTVLEIRESHVILQRGAGNNVAIRAWGSVTILDSVGDGVSIKAGHDVRVSGSAGHNFIAHAKNIHLLGVGNDAVVFAQDEVSARRFGAGAVVEARARMIVGDVCGPGCRFISPLRQGSGMASPECRVQDRRPNEFLRSTLGLR